MRKLVFGAFIAGLVLLGLAAQAGAYLLALPSPQEEAGRVAGDSVPFAEKGPHAVGVRRLAGDAAPLPMTVWYPALEPDSGRFSLTYAYAINMLGPDSSMALATYAGQAGPGATPDYSAGPYPLVILSHGFAIRGSSYAWLAEHLASYGLVVIAPQHRESLDPGVLWRSTIQRPRDVLKVLSYVDEAVQAGGEFEGLIDHETVAVVGHSYGGYTALVAAGARMDAAAFEAACETAYGSDDPLVFLCDALLPRVDDMAELAGLGSVPPGLWPAWADPRVDAVISMAGDAAMFGQDGLAEVTVPVMAIGGTADKDAPFMWGTRPAYEYVSSFRKVEIALDGAEHLIFAGECDVVRRALTLVSTGFCSDPAWDRNQAHDLIEHYTTAFLLAELKQDAEARRALAADTTGIPALAYRAQGW
jgi:predicted dienelactone hydrolase